MIEPRANQVLYRRNAAIFHTIETAWLYKTIAKSGVKTGQKICYDRAASWNKIVAAMENLLGFTYSPFLTAGHDHHANTR